MNDTISKPCVFCESLIPDTYPIPDIKLGFKLRGKIVCSNCRVLIIKRLYKDGDIDIQKYLGIIKKELQ